MLSAVTGLLSAILGTSILGFPASAASAQECDCYPFGISGHYYFAVPNSDNEDQVETAIHENDISERVCRLVIPLDYDYPDDITANEGGLQILRVMGRACVENLTRWDWDACIQVFDMNWEEEAIVVPVPFWGNVRYFDECI